MRWWQGVGKYANHGRCVKHDRFVDEAVSELLASKCVREVSWEETDVCSPLGVHDSGKKLRLILDLSRLICMLFVLSLRTLRRPRRSMGKGISL